MSRSNHHGCSCFMCQYTPARNKRADAALEADAGDDPAASLREREDDEVHVGDILEMRTGFAVAQYRFASVAPGITSELLETSSEEVEEYEDLSCPCCGPEFDTFECTTCGASFMGADDAARCCTDPHFGCMEKCGDGCSAPEAVCTCMLRWYPNRCAIHPEKNQ